MLAGNESKSHEVGYGPSTVHSPSIPPCLAPVSDHPVSLIHTLRPISLSIMHVQVRATDMEMEHTIRFADILNKPLE